MFTFKVATPELTKAINDGFAKVATQLEAANALHAREISVLEDLLGLLRRQCRPSRPTNLAIKLESESMADTLSYSVKAEAPLDPDVEARKLKVEVDGAVVKEESFAANTTDFGLVDVPQDSAVKITLVDVDDSNNESAPLVSEFTALDTITPPSPTGLNVALVGEAEAPVAPPVEEPAPPAEEPSAPPAEEVPAPPAEEAPPAE